MGFSTNLLSRHSILIIYNPRLVQTKYFTSVNQLLGTHEKWKHGNSVVRPRA